MTTTQELSNALPTTGQWHIDPMHSTLAFAIRHHAVGRFRGLLSPIAGVFDAESGELSGEVRVDALVLPGLDSLRNHLMSSDFFDAESHPVLSFRSDDVVGGVNGGVDVRGELTVRGVTKPVAATGSVRGPLTTSDGGALGIDLSATIDRRDYGMTFNGDIVEGILALGWDVEINAALELNLATD